MNNDTGTGTGAGAGAGTGYRATFFAAKRAPIGVFLFLTALLAATIPASGQPNTDQQKVKSGAKPGAVSSAPPDTGTKTKPASPKLPNTIEQAPLFTRDMTKQKGPLAKTPGTAGQAKPKDWRYSKRTPDVAFGAFQRGFFLTAFKEATKRVEKNPNDSAAMTLIGELLKDGLGVRGNPSEAVRWFKLAAARGNRQADFALGRAYLSGQGAKQDIGQARTFFEQAAAKGHGAALYNLGIMEIGGDPRRNTGDFKKAADYFLKAAARGSMDAVYSLAILYRRGAGVLKDDIKASQYLKRAADRHHLAAMTEYAIALFNGKGVAKDEKGAAGYLTRAAWRNSPIAQNRLARLYVIGRGVEKDIVQAMKWHIIARATGIKDKWLDSKLPTLTRTQRKIVGLQVRKFAGK